MSDSQIEVYVPGKLTESLFYTNKVRVCTHCADMVH